MSKREKKVVTLFSYQTTVHSKNDSSYEDIPGGFVTHKDTPKRHLQVLKASIRLPGFNAVGEVRDETNAHIRYSISINHTQHSLNMLVKVGAVSVRTVERDGKQLRVYRATPKAMEVWKTGIKLVRHPGRGPKTSLAK